MFTMRTCYWLTAAGAGLLMAGGLSVASDSLDERPPSHASAVPFGTSTQTPHFVLGRLFRSEPRAAIDVPAPASLPESEQRLPPVVNVSRNEGSHSAPTPQTASPAVIDNHQSPETNRPVLETRATPHLFFGDVRLTKPIHRPNPEPQLPRTDAPAVALTDNAAQPQAIAAQGPPQHLPPPPLESAQVQPAERPDLSAAPTRLASLSQQQPLAPLPAERAPTTAAQPLKPATVAALKPAAVRSTKQQQTAVADDRLSRQGGSAAPLQPAEVFSVPRPDFFAEELQRTGLESRLPQSASSLQPAEIEPLNAPSAAAEPQFKLASLQQALPGPAAPLQPAEVLPIPTPYSPAAPRVPAIDQDRPILALTTNIAPPSGRLPQDIAVERFQGDYPPWAARGYAETVYFWDAPALCYGPLRFEEVNLERYGYGCCHVLQPFVSAGHFAGSLLALPYNMVNRPPWECIYPLGHYRPGSPVPYRKIWPEWNPLAAAAECGAIAGLILLIP